MDNIGAIIALVIFSLIIIFALREVVTWYTKRNEQIKNQQEIIRLLKKQVGEKKELKTLAKNQVRLRDKEKDEIFDIHKSKWKKEQKKGNPDRYEVIEEN